MRKNKQNLSQNIYGDRFIPTQVHKQAFHIKPQSALEDTPFSNYQNLLNDNILKRGSITKPTNKKIMNFTTRKSQQMPLLPPTLIQDTKNHPSKITQKRRISKKPYKVLQAPNLQDNFYLNILDWSRDNQISVALQNQLYLWTSHSSQAVKMYQTDLGDEICSVAFCGNNTISIGNTFGQIIFVDLAKEKVVNKFDAHTGRIGSLNWGKNLLASGSKDGNAAVWDARFGNVNRYKAHTQEICGLKWSPDGKYIASGGNDNKLLVYSHQKQSELVKFHQHTAAIKAIGWCPSNPSVIASGGGTIDRCIRFFSIHSLKESFHIDTGSQVCNLQFSRISNQMITTHGYSLNQINVWSSSDNWQNFQGLTKVDTLTGHANRVLYLADSPDGRSVVTGAGDETLKFWNVFGTGSEVEEASMLGLHMDLR